MTKFFTSLIFTSLLLMNVSGQEKKFDIEIHGFVGFDAIHDSRVSKAVRHNHILLYPLSAKYDNERKDLNSRNELDMGSVHSRFSLHVKGPTVNNFTTFAMIEGDFAGGNFGGDGDFMLRHGYIQIGYSKVSLLAGQTWHPFFIPENFPQTLNAGVGVPVHPLSRNAQLRFTYKPTDKLELSASLIEQGAFRSAGFSRGSEESATPEIALQVKAGGTGPVWASFTAGYKTLAIPYTVEPTAQPTTTGSYHYSASVRFKTQPLIIRAGTIYGGNLTEHALHGGLGRTVASVGKKPEYKSLYTRSLWIDMGTTSKTWDPGLFLGRITNLGASEEIIVSDKLGRDANIGNIVLISPRLRYLIGTHLWVGIEYIFNQAAYGQTFDADTEQFVSSFNEKGKPNNLKYYTTHRSLLSFRYTF